MIAPLVDERIRGLEQKLAEALDHSDPYASLRAGELLRVLERAYAARRFLDRVAHYSRQRPGPQSFA